jgi:prepilin-type N-terminal cleavage/methylation domain-containing protein
VNSDLQKQAGFTLIEMLIVIVILGIMAMIIIPQISVSSEDATLRTLQTNLKILRKVVELYNQQHDKTFPGSHYIDGVPTKKDKEAEEAFVKQLTKYTAIDGAVSDTKDITYKFGPYIRGGVLPTNPYSGENDIICDAKEDDITIRESDGKSGWIFYPITGVLMANDGSHDDL